jgi:serine/threonine protein kinase
MGSSSDHDASDLPNADHLPRGARFAPGAVLFDRYTIVREIGRGGMGVVLLAWDAELEIELALKLVPDLLIHDHEALDDLKQEVLRGMTLTHPGIVRTHGLVKDDHTAAILMEYVDGGTFHDLKRLQKWGCFDAPDLLPWLEQLCPALDHAHFECHVAHRDLKPRNLMYTMAGRIKIADFGISSNLGDAMTRMTLTGPSSGTPPYMSPQQVMGDRPSHLDDIYSLGATIYELLTGRPPFHKGEIVYQVLEREAIPLEAKRQELGVIGKAVIPEHWEKAVAACLSKDPGARPGSAGTLLEALRQPSHAHGAPTPPVDGPITIKTRTRRRRALSHWRTIGISGLGAVAITAVALVRFSPALQDKTDIHSRPLPLGIYTARVLPTATVGADYMHQMNAAGGAPPYAWSLASGDLPKGVTLDQDGLLHGVPLEAAISRFDVVVADGKSRSLRRSHEFRAEPKEEPVDPKPEDSMSKADPLRFVSSPVLPTAVSGNPYQFKFLTEGAVLPLEWTLASGSLPEGLFLGVDGVISGVPLNPVAAEFTVKARDAAGVEAVLAVSLDITKPAAPVPPEPEPAFVATKEEPFENTLGMRFVPAGTDGVYFSVWLTRVRDFAAFSTATAHKKGRMLSIQKGGKAELVALGHTWDNPGFNQTDDHPVCGVSWLDARAFCQWLTTTEHEAGVLPTHMEYRLPKDAEWLRALGIADLTSLPTFPWGNGSPPGLRCNLAGEEIRIDEIPRNWKNILGFRDNAPFPSPVNHFPPNEFGLHDTYGNLWQILDDVTEAGRSRRLLRGGSWLTHDPAELKLDARFDRIETGRGVDAGFRCVIASIPADE